ncbi:MAG TPA: DUF72 domain-containing protein [Candidatus Eisenbacteria bacterium]|nr:DUF72 domain-containing protein [Candidatus Eisenbacteria bacterium]
MGAFYPPGAKQQDWLPFYAGIFDTVELDTTFYHAPRPSVVRSWARHTPAEFRFAAKLPHAITHEAGLVGTGPALAEFVTALEPLGEKLGPLLAQLPAEYTRDQARTAALERFLAQAPADVRVAVEFRHASWHAPATWELLRRHGAALAWTEWRGLPRVAQVTAGFLYLRWLGDRREIARYDRVVVDRTAELNAWEHDLRRVLPDVREVYGYFNNHWAGHSPASAHAMKLRLGLAAVAPRDRWPQAELF